jgi:molybdate transport system regulatory protein
MAGPRSVWAACVVVWAMKPLNRITGARLRLVLAQARALGPGKADLLASIASSGSLTAAAAELGMSYRRAWLLVEELNGMFREPLVRTTKGGRGGGGQAGLTDLGGEVLRLYRLAEEKTEAAIRDEMKALRGVLK